MENKEFIIRQKDKTKNFSIVCNNCYKDNTISLQAMGLFGYLMTLPDNWEVHKEELVSHFSNGRDAVFNAFNELIKKGYITVEETKGEKGRFSKKIYKVYEISQGETTVEKKTRVKRCDNPLAEDHTWNTVTGNPLTENPTLLNTNNTKDLLLNTCEENEKIVTEPFPDVNDFPISENKSATADLNERKTKFGYSVFYTLHRKLYTQLYQDGKLDKTVCKAIPEYNYKAVNSRLKSILKNPFFDEKKILLGISNAAKDDFVINQNHFSLLSILANDQLNKLVEGRISKSVSKNYQRDMGGRSFNCASVEEYKSEDF